MVFKTDLESSSLLSKPDNEKPPVFQRQFGQCNDLPTKFTDTKNDFSKQFSRMYTARLAELRAVLTKKIRNTWGNIRIAKLPELTNLNHRECVIIGTLYKHQPWKPSVLRELNDDLQLTLPAPRANYCSEEDQPFLEDEMLRIRLVGDKVDLKYIITGVVCAVRGQENSDDTFTVKDWCFPGCPPKQNLSTTVSKGKLVLISGLNLARNMKSLPVNLLSEWLCGMVGNTTVQEDSTSIVKVIFAGNTVYNQTKTHTRLGHTAGKAQDIAMAKDRFQSALNTDLFLSTIAQSCSVILMPGEHDPTNIMLPQRPLHPCLLPKAARLQSFKGVTNPWINKICDRIIIGHSGQSINDIVKASGDTEISSMEWLERSLSWRHICPTAPDTLLSCPYYDEDLFIIKECPDIYFVGNTSKFETKLWKGEENQMIRLICVPEFSSTHTAVIVDLENLETNYICFGSNQVPT